MEIDGTYNFNWSVPVIPSKFDMQYSTELKISTNEVCLLLSGTVLHWLNDSL